MSGEIPDRNLKLEWRTGQKRQKHHSIVVAVSMRTGW